MDRKQIISLISYLTSKYKVLTVAQACMLADVSKSTYYSWLQLGEDGGVDRRFGHNPNRKPPENALSAEDVQKVRDILISPEYVDLSVIQTYHQLLRKGIKLCSLSTMHRIAADAGFNKDRRNIRARKPRNKPRAYEVTAPNQVWCWDITEIKLCSRSAYLYMAIDLYSRFIVQARVFPVQTGAYAAQFLGEAFSKYNVKGIGLSVHSDNGTPMKAEETFAVKAEFEVSSSFSRPHVSDDNPYIESVFGTFKYCLGLEKMKFETIEDAQAFIDAKVNDYHGRAHKGLGYSTPAARFHGQEKEIIDIYNATDQAYYESHPLRFKNQPSRAAKYAIAGPQYLNPTEEMKAKMLAEEAPS